MGGPVPKESNPAPKGQLTSKNVTAIVVDHVPEKLGSDLDVGYTRLQSRHTDESKSANLAEKTRSGKALAFVSSTHCTGPSSWRRRDSWPG
jgi:hypothetical protein